MTRCTLGFLTVKFSWPKAFVIRKILLQGCDCMMRATSVHVPLPVERQAMSVGMEEGLRCYLKVYAKFRIIFWDYLRITHVLTLE